MKKSLIFTLFLISTTSFAEVKSLKCEMAGPSISQFYGDVKITSRTDVAIVADVVLAVVEAPGDDADLFIQQDMRGTEDVIKAGQLMKNEVTSIDLASSEESLFKGGLKINLGMPSPNARLTYNGVQYTADCK